MMRDNATVRKASVHLAQARVLADDPRGTFHVRQAHITAREGETDRYNE
ncbi:hypothetical protein [Halorhabdus sp. CUG00001]|nr:hypothetical protein [Halorhabdus sp. CUG00001]